MIPVPDNYGRWENIIAANPDAVGAVGLCSIDIPNLAQIKERNAADVADRRLRPRSADAAGDQGWTGRR